MKVAFNTSTMPGRAAGYAVRRAGRLRACTRSRAVSDVTKDPRYILAVPGVRSELVVPLLLKDRCIGVFDLESPERDAFNKKHVKLLTLLASEAAVAIENARLYESIRTSEARFEKELRFAQRVQKALLPQELPKRLRGVDVAWHFDPMRELAAPSATSSRPTRTRWWWLGRCLRQRRAGRALRRRHRRDDSRPTFRRRLEKKSSTPVKCLAASIASCTIRNLEEYYGTLCYAMFEFRSTGDVRELGLPFPIRCVYGKAEQLNWQACLWGRLAVRVRGLSVSAGRGGDVFVLC